MALNNSFLSIKDIKKKYKNNNQEIEVLKGISFEIEKGEIVSILGVNGAGKTTLFSIISTLCPATSGDIIFEKESVYKDIISYRKIIGLCPQKPNLDPLMTIEEAMIFAGKLYGLSSKEAILKKDLLIEKYNLTKYAKSIPTILSGGYKQRFVIARTLMHSPKIILLDEPTVGLDPQIRMTLWENILELKKEGITIILTTHYLEEAEKLSDKICVIHNGNLIAFDKTEELKKEHNLASLESVFLELTKEENKKDMLL
jgi:ABC-2 type transport system ATP-binding protein